MRNLESRISEAMGSRVSTTSCTKSTTYVVRRARKLMGTTTLDVVLAATSSGDLVLRDLLYVSICDFLSQ